MTIRAVIPVAANTMEGLVLEQIMPTKRANTTVNTIRIGSPNLLKKSEQHPIAIEIANSKTERIIIEGVLTKIFLKLSDFMAHTQIRAVIMSWILSNV